MAKPPPDINPRWINKLARSTKMDPDVRVLFKVAGVIVIASLIWTVAKRLLDL